MTSALSACAWAFLAIAGSATPASAQDSATPTTGEVQDIVEINGIAGGSGRTAVNAAAGNLNQQANVGVIAIGDTAIAVGSVTQISDAVHAPLAGQRSATIAEGAFAGSTGMLAVNVVAGTGNQQGNLAVIAIGIEGRVVTDAMLSQTRASSSPSGASALVASPEAVAGISPGAFAGSSGLVQVSLIGGERNSSANLFALSVSGNADP